MRRGTAHATWRVAHEHGVARGGAWTWRMGIAWARVPAQSRAHERYEAVELLEAVGVGGEGGEAADSVARLSGPPRSSHHRVASPQHLQAEVEVEVRAKEA